MTATRNILSPALLLVLMISVTGCHQAWHYCAILDCDAVVPDGSLQERAVSRAGQPAEPLKISLSGNQTVLVASQIRDNPNKLDDERARTFVMIIDGPPKPGERYDITPKNGRFIENSPFRPARAPYDGAVGHVKVVRMTEEAVVASVVIRNTYGDVGEPRHVLRGRHRFFILDHNTPLLRTAGVELVGQAAPVEPPTAPDSTLEPDTDVDTSSDE